MNLKTLFDKFDQFADAPNAVLMNLGPGTDRRLVGGRSESQARTPAPRIIYHANINKSYSFRT
jgi:hypothetical protein